MKGKLGGFRGAKRNKNPNQRNTWNVVKEIPM
jgi:hypothetical protein